MANPPGSWPAPSHREVHVEAEVTNRGSRGSGHGPGQVARYVAKYDYPDLDVKAGQVFVGIEAVPTNIIVVPLTVGP